MRFAQSGAPEAEDAEEDGEEAPSSASPSVPFVEEPPVLSKVDFAPEAALALRLFLAPEMAFLRGEIVALPAALATPPTPEATLDVLDSPADPRV